MVNNFKVIYLASGHAQLKYNNVIYQDKIIQRDLDGDMLDVDLDQYDILLATPPCNYYSRSNYRRETSIYALETKHLLPAIIKKFKKQNKPFIVENVINKKLMRNIIEENKDIFYIEHGRHSYFTNVNIDISHLPQIFDNIQNKSSKQRQGGVNVNIVLDYFIEYVIQELVDIKNTIIKIIELVEEELTNEEEEKELIIKEEVKE